jgi:ADP-ribosylglycohydrolase
MEEQYLGCMLGLAIGDALGFPTEFLSLEDIRRQFGTLGVTDYVAYHRFALGTFSDDTQMSVALAEGLLEAPDASLDSLMTAAARRFIAWARSPENNRAPGMSCLAGCRRLEEGFSWRESGVPDSKGCGAAMRTAPIGLLFHRRRGRLLEVARASSLLTHGHLCAQAGAVATALAVSLALDSTPPAIFLDRLLEATAPVSLEFADRLGRVRQALPLPSDEAFALLGEGWVSEEAVAGAVYAFLRSPDDFRASVLLAANTNGDSDSLACITGAISGAYNGVEAIPASWRERVEKAERLEDLARRLYAAATEAVER